MQKIFFKQAMMGLMLLGSGYLHAQLVATVQIPPAGLTHKPQLWNMMLVNPGPDAMTLQVQISLQDVLTGQKIITGSTRIVQVPKGAKMLQYGDVAPVQYNYAAAVPDKTPDGFLPVGHYRVCYTFIKNPDKSPEPIQEECTQVDIQPLSPPQLIVPAHETVLETAYPQLNWLPPGPAQLFSNLQYELKISEVLPGQNMAEAMQQNTPVFSKGGIKENYLPYPASATPFVSGKTYAWQVVAKDNSQYAAQTDVWSFTVKAITAPEKNKSQLYNRLRKGNEAGYGQAGEQLLFAYDNEANDSAVTCQVFDMAQPGQPLVKKNITLSGGANYISFDLIKHGAFVKGNRYRFELVNSRGEKWSLIFEII
jgi:hypothetical protein